MDSATVNYETVDAAPSRTRQQPLSRRAITTAIVLHVIIILGAIAMFFPFLWTIITSISPGAGLGVTPRLIPENPSLEAYGRLFSEQPFLRIILNSLGL